MIQKLLRPDLVKRFIQSIREEGWSSAINKARVYTSIVIGNAGRSALSVGAQGKVKTDHTYYNGMWQTLARQGAFHVETPPASLRKKRKIALIADLNLPQCRKYRVEQLAEFWRAQDVEVIYSHYQDVPRSMNAMQDATHLFFYRVQNMPACSMYMYEARRLRLPILYDIDDPLFSVSAYETYQNMDALQPALKAHFLSEAPKYLDAMNSADIITVSTPGMVEHAKLYTRRPIYLRRNFADQATLDAGKRAMVHAEAKSTTSGFKVAFASGSQGHEVDFELIEPQIIEFLQNGSDRSLVILGHFDVERLPEPLQGKVETHAFSDYSGYLETLAKVDCAVMPLTDDIFNRCKSGVRVLDASAVAVSSIVGTVGDMANLVQHGDTGYIASEPSDWLTHLETFASDKSACSAMGLRARENLETNWSGTASPHIIDPELLDWVKQ